MMSFPVSSRISLLKVGLALLVVAGCDNSQEPTAMRVVTSQAIAGLLGSDAEALPPVTRQEGFLAVSEQLPASTEAPVIGVVIEDRDAQALLTQSGQNGSYVTWLSADRASFTFVGGTILVRTSGLGHDLQNADVSQLFGAMTSGQQTGFQREHVYLTRDYQHARHVFDCKLITTDRTTITIRKQRHNAVRFDETCNGENTSFTNSYWFDTEAGIIVQSVQWVHPQAGRAFFQLIGLDAG